MYLHLKGDTVSYAFCTICNIHCTLKGHQAPQIPHLTLLVTHTHRHIVTCTCTCTCTCKIIDLLS